MAIQPDRASDGIHPAKGSVTRHQSRRASKANHRRAPRPTSFSDDPFAAHRAPRIFVIEAKQYNGQWQPIAAPAFRPFTLAAAKKRLREYLQEQPAVAIKHDRLRIVEYERVSVIIVDEDARGKKK